MAWNEPGSGSRDPWNNNKHQGKGNKSDLDVMLKRLQGYLGKWGRGSGNLFAVVFIVVLIWLLMSSYTLIGVNQSGVVLRFGHYARTLSPGIHLKMPSPIESVSKVATATVRSVSERASMLTSDENIVLVSFNVQYQVSNPRTFLFSARDPENTLREAAEAAVRAVVGAHTMDDILSGSGDNHALVGSVGAKTVGQTAPKAITTRGRQPDDNGGTLQQQTSDILQHTLNSYRIGLQVNDVSFQKVAPPQEVKDAFDDVNAAREDKQGSENKARAYASKVIPQARGNAARILAEAAAYKASRVARALGDAERFRLLLKQYRVAPKVTRQRLWLENMEHVMARMFRVIDGSGGRNIINIPGRYVLPGMHKPGVATGVVLAPQKSPLVKESQP